MPTKNYVPVSLPKTVWKRVRELLDEEKVTGYRNPSEFILDSVRRRIEQIENKEKNDKDLDEIKHIINKVFEEYNK